MALSTAERQQVLSAVAEILTKDIHDELMEFYAVAVAVTECNPEQVNNEIRNAVTHLSRALTSVEIADAEEDIKKASSHVARAKRDTLKIIIVELHDRIQLACAEVKVFQGTISPAFLSRRDVLTAQRRNVLIAEIKGDPRTLDGLVQMYLDADQLHSDLLATFNLTSKRVNRVAIWFMSLFQGASGVFWACVAGVIVFLICAFLWPDTMVLGNGMRKFVHMSPVRAAEGPKPNPTAKTLSTPGKPGTPMPTP
jgi:hypothetical protein